MLIAHLPSGYLLGHAARARGAAMAAALIGSVAPDFDVVVSSVLCSKAQRALRLASTRAFPSGFGSKVEILLSAGWG